MDIFGIWGSENPVRSSFKISNSLKNLRELLDKYEIKTIPALKVIQANGEVIAGDARNEVQVTLESSNALSILIQDRGQDDPVALFAEWEKAVRAHI